MQRNSFLFWIEIKFIQVRDYHAFLAFDRLAHGHTIHSSHQLKLWKTWLTYQVVALEANCIYLASIAWLADMTIGNISVRETFTSFLFCLLRFFIRVFRNSSWSFLACESFIVLLKTDNSLFGSSWTTWFAIVFRLGWKLLFLENFRGRFFWSYRTFHNRYTFRFYFW